MEPSAKSVWSCLVRKCNDHFVLYAENILEAPLKFNKSSIQFYLKEIEKQIRSSTIVL